MRGQELMSDDDEFRRVAEIERAANGKPSYLDMDAAFCARMYAAITAEGGIDLVAGAGVEHLTLQPDGACSFRYIP